MELSGRLEQNRILISFDPKQGRIKSSYPIIEGNTSTNNDDYQSKQTFTIVWSIVQDKDNSIWFSQSGANPLWRFDPHAEKFQVIHSISGAPMQMKVNQKTGDIWFTTFGGGTLGVIHKKLENNSSSTIANNNNNGSNNNSSSSQYKVTEFNLGNDTFPSGL